MKIKVSNILDEIFKKESSKPKVVRSNDILNGPNDDEIIERMLAGRSRESSQETVRTISQEETLENVELESRSIETTTPEVIESPFPEIDSSDKGIREQYYPSIMSLLRYEAGIWVCTDGKIFADQYPAYLWQLKIGYKGKTDKKPITPNPSPVPGGTMDHAQLEHLGFDESGHTGFQKELTAGGGILMSDTNINTNNIVWRTW